MPSTPRYSNILDNLHLRIFQMQWMRLEAGQWNTQDVRDAFWRFYIDDRDGASLHWRGGVYSLRAEKMYFVPEGVLFSCANHAAVGHFYIHFDVIGAPRPLLQNLFDAPVEIQSTPYLKNEVRVLQSAAQSQEELDVSWQFRAKSLLFGALAAVLQSSAAQTAHYWNLAEQHEPVAPALDWIEGNLSRKIDNEILARCCHWSADHFVRRFRECVGQTPAQYVQSRRIGFAAQQLLFTSKSIDEIARDAGFANRFHFSRVFTQQQGCTPRAYRKTGRV